MKLAAASFSPRKWSSSRSIIAPTITVSLPFQRSKFRGEYSIVGFYTISLIARNSKEEWVMDIGFGRCGARLGRKVGKGGSLSVDECQGQRLWRRRNGCQPSTRTALNLVPRRDIIESIFPRTVYLCHLFQLVHVYYSSRLDFSWGYYIGLKSCVDDSFINEISAQPPKKGRFSEGRGPRPLRVR